jgi:hypothetical protein
VAAKKGIRELCLYNFQTRQVYTLSGLADEQDDGTWWRYIRSAQVSQGQLLFAYNQGQGMYKLGAVDISGVSGATFPEALEAVFTERDFSGGVSRPVAAGGAIYYRGSFSKFDALLRYPESPGSLAGIRVPLALKPWSAEDTARALPLNARHGGVSDRPYDDAPEGQTGFPQAALPSKRYAGISYMNPFKFWLPLPLIRMTRDSITVDGGGILSLMYDPVDTNIVQFNLNFDARSLMAAGYVQWINYALGFPLQLYVSDDIDKTLGFNVRITQAALQGTFSIPLGNGRTRFDIIPGLNAAFASVDPGDNSNVYTWSYEEYFYSAILGLGVSSIMRPSWALFGQGLSLYGYAQFLLDQDEPFSFPPAPRLDGVFSAAMEPWLPLRRQVYGAWDTKGMDLHGRSGYYLNAAFSSAVPVEYAAQSHIPLEWLAGAEAELKLFSLDIQKSLSHLYYNRIYGTLAWRGSLYDDQGLKDAKGHTAEGTLLAASPQGSYRLAQSVMLRLGLTITTMIIPASPFRFTPNIWGAWKFPNLNDGNVENDFAFGIGVDFSL